MTKKGYQKGLPRILPPPPPPPVPAPRASSDQVGRAPADAEQPPRPPAPTPAPAPAPRRRSRAAVVGLTVIGLVNLVVAGLLVYAVVTATGGDDPEPRSPEVAEGAAGTDPPRLLPTDESYVEAVVQPDGQVVVQQWIRTEAPLRRLRLALPALPGGGVLSAAGIEVVADGVVVDGPRRLTDRAVDYTFPRTTDVQVRYRLAGAVERSDSAPGRALALATTLDVTYSPRIEHETRVVRAAEVLALACSATLEDSPTPCGEYDGDGQWRVELDGPRIADRVMAQLTLG